MSGNHTKESRFKPIPVYTTPGDWEAILVYPYLYNTMGEWIGWVTPEQEVFDVDGIYVGWLTDEPRVLRKRIYDRPLPRKDPPPEPEKIRPPATVPLPPMMAELPFEIMDVLEEEPRLLHTQDSGELKEDMR